MLARFRPLIKYGVASIAFCVAVGGVMIYDHRLVLTPLGWLCAVSCILLFLGLAAGGILALWAVLRQRNIPGRMDSRDPVFRDWLEEKLWIARELGFFRTSGSTLGDVVIHLRARIEREYGHAVGALYSFPPLLLKFDESRVLAHHPAPLTDERMRIYLNGLAAISGGALSIPNLRVSQPDGDAIAINLVVWDHDLHIRVPRQAEDWDITLAAAINGALREDGLQLAWTQPHGMPFRLYALVNRETLDKLRRQMNW